VTTSTQNVIRQTKNWIDEIVIGLTLCPFAAPVVANDNIDYILASSDKTEQHLQQLSDCFVRLDEQAEIETSLLIFPGAYSEFDDYLELVYLANLLLEDLGYSGIYQLASFHPDYRFTESAEDDASNFSNRSPYPMLHILRESSIEKAVKNYKNIEQVPSINIKRLQQIGYKKMQQKLDNILQGSK
jgi:uncharacterized protein